MSGTGLDGYGDDLSRAAHERGPRSFVHGSMRVEGRRVRVSAELVDARTRESPWSQQCERELAGVVAVQSDIAIDKTKPTDQWAPGRRPRARRRAGMTRR